MATPDLRFGSDAAIRPQTEIEVRSFDKKSKTFAVFSVRLPGEGDSNVSAEALAQAIPSLNLADLKSKPKEQIGNHYKLVKPLRNFTRAELSLRQSKLSK
jgi:hypothetical protein